MSRNVLLFLPPPQSLLFPPPVASCTPSHFVYCRARIARLEMEMYHCSYIRGFNQIPLILQLELDGLSRSC